MYEKYTCCLPEYEIFVTDKKYEMKKSDLGILFDNHDF